MKKKRKREKSNDYNSNAADRNVMFCPITSFNNYYTYENISTFRTSYQR